MLILAGFAKKIIGDIWEGGRGFPSMDDMGCGTILGIALRVRGYSGIPCLKSETWGTQRYQCPKLFPPFAARRMGHPVKFLEWKILKS